MINIIFFLVSMFSYHLYAIKTCDIKVQGDRCFVISGTLMNDGSRSKEETLCSGAVGTCSCVMGYSEIKSVTCGAKTIVIGGSSSKLKMINSQED